MFVALVLSCSAAGTFADSLASLLDEAFNGNPRLRAAERQWDAARQRIKAEGGLDDPMLGATLERENTRMSDYMDVEYMMSQQFPAWGQRASRVDAARLRAEAAGLRYLEAGRELRASVAVAAWDLWLAEQRITTLREMAALTDDLTESVRARYESGQASSADLTRAQIEHATLTNEVANLERERSVSLAALNALLNAEPEKERTLRDIEVPELNIHQPADLYAAARKFSFGYRAAEKDVEALASEAKAARRERRPALSVSIAARQPEGSGSIEAIDTGIAMNLPWIWNGKYKGSIASAEAERAMADATRQDEWRALQQQISDFHAKYENAARTASVLRDAIVPLARQAVEQTQAAYMAGTGSLLDRIESQRTLLEAELNLHTAIADRSRALARLNQFIAPIQDAEAASGAAGSAPSN